MSLELENKDFYNQYQLILKSTATFLKTDNEHNSHFEKPSSFKK